MLTTRSNSPSLGILTSSPVLTDPQNITLVYVLLTGRAGPLVGTLAGEGTQTIVTDTTVSTRLSRTVVYVLVTQVTWGDIGFGI